ncbi:guanine nucleotide binding protein, alpha subunit [Rhizoclosmatium globosum]|uniref:Guanine nucleotide binding protein, alpha subunit n=1 Tax=Rhizoclosmatium globosum TaxID=329046 RepID=A0A1Y2CRV9_9FUNG|nr:guanine nucleotide-binding protein subunit alpha [Rhizoclosmatium hyalinum]ORY49751.1 guanine nucleotide binding protein, alpha subunit [Rhizoclosmatium globosum]|eukprot:ORY49751.1 guanine nucleotide binding protein, alpha subunit [Rhizoclosmatium globosum]
MGNCGSSESAAAVVASNEIDKQLKLEQKNIQQNIKLLLLGPGETGKSTVLKQFKLIYGEGYTANEKLAFRTTILTNVMTCTLSLINAMDMLKIPYGFDPTTVTLPTTEEDDDDDENALTEDDKVRDDRGSAEEVFENENEYEPDQEKKVSDRMALIESEIPKLENPMAKYAAKLYKRAGGRNRQTGTGPDAAKVVKSHDMSFGISPGETLPDEIVNAVEVVWKDAGIQYCYSRANEFQLVDCCGYFLNRAKEVCNPEYNPTEQDILNTRQMTTTVSETRIMVEKKIFRIFDVGGQRGERKKWAPYFDDVDAIIYLVAISSYDQVCLEDSSTNRMVESMNLFDSICNHPLFKMTEMIVFMNKIDLFKEKLEKTPISQYFPTYQGPNTYESCSEYFASRFIALNLFPEKSIYLHFTWATDTKQIKAVLAIVNHSILRGNLTKAGL